MPDLMKSIQSVIETDAQTVEYNRRKAENLQHGKWLRFAWAENRNTLYKFKSLRNGGSRQVQDIIENSRLYFSTPDQFNDPCYNITAMALKCRDLGNLGGLSFASERWDELLHSAVHLFRRIIAEKSAALIGWLK